MMWFSPKFYGLVFFISVFILTFKVVSLQHNLRKCKCSFRHPSTTLRPSNNEYGCYRTKKQQECLMLRRFAAISPIQTFGDPNEGELKLLYSPNIILNEPYKPNRAYIYNVSCPEGFLAYLKILSLDLSNSCDDYLEVHSFSQPPRKFSCDSADNVTDDSALCIIDNISHVLFRSGMNASNNNKMSFKASLVCFKSQPTTDQGRKRHVASIGVDQELCRMSSSSEHFAPQGNYSINTDALSKTAFDVIINGINFANEDMNGIHLYQNASNPVLRGARLYQNASNPVLRAIARAILNCTNDYCGTRRIMLTVNTKDCDALHGSEYELMCTMRPITGMTLPPLMEWVGPDGNVLVSGGNVKISEVETRGIVSTFSLSFHPVLSSQGGRYTCRATVNIPWMKEQPDQLNATFHMPVTTQAMFQLKLYPLPHCVTWDLEKAHDVETSIKRELEKAVRERCECDFSSTAINSGVFSCQTATCQSNCLPITHVIYRAIINGTSDFPTADQLIDHMKEWQKSSSSLLYNVFHLNLASNDECQLRIGSLYEKEC